MRLVLYHQMIPEHYVLAVVDGGNHVVLVVCLDVEKHACYHIVPLRVEVRRREGGGEGRAEGREGVIYNLQIDKCLHVSKQQPETRRLLCPQNTCQLFNR